MNSSDSQLSRIFNVDYGYIQSALVNLEAEGRINWYRVGDGSLNNVCLII